MHWLIKPLRKRVWFVVVNSIAITGMIIKGVLRFDLESIVIVLVVLLAMNWLMSHRAAKDKDWK
jgi:hypothetical protein